MATFLLKKFTRRNPNSSAGELVEEWSLQAGSNVTAVRVARERLEAVGFHPPDDFAILRDETGKKIWDYVAPWGETDQQ